MKKLIADKPHSQGVANALKRARQLTDIHWTAVRPMPSNACIILEPGKHGAYFNTYVNPWRERRGVIYSSCRSSEKFVPYNISLETYMTALLNPRSVMYTENLHNTPGNSVSCYYGIVCSCFVSFVTGRPYRTPCRAWPTLPGVTEIDTADLDGLRLCDIVDDPQQHIAIITGIWRDESGSVQRIEVSESLQPFATRADYTPEGFRKFWLEQGYRIFRYDGIHDVTYTPSPYIPLEGEEAPEVPDYAVMTNYGNKANCLLHEEPVELTVLKGDWDAFEVRLPDGSVKTYPAGEQVKIDCPMVGDYTAAAVRGEEKSTPVVWHVHDLHAQPEKDVYAVGEAITIRFTNAETEPVFHCIINNSGNSIRGQADVTEPDAVTLPGLTEPGAYWCFVTARNEYGAYVSNHYHFEVK